MRFRSLPFVAVFGIPVMAAAQTHQPVTSASGDRLQLSCAPISLVAPPAAGLRVLGGYIHGKLMFGPGETLIVNAGRSQGLQAGQRYFVRRIVDDRLTSTTAKEVRPFSIHTAGWVEIVDANDLVAVAAVRHACDGIMEGDYLEPYTEPVLPQAAAAPADADFGHPARIVLADERRQTGYPGMLMLIDEGSETGIRAGQRLTIFRETLSGAGPVLSVGTAEVMNVRPQTSLIRIDTSRDAVYVGDLVAVHR